MKRLPCNQACCYLWLQGIQYERMNSTQAERPWLPYLHPSASRDSRQRPVPLGSWRMRMSLSIVWSKIRGLVESSSMAGLRAGISRVLYFGVVHCQHRPKSQGWCTKLGSYLRRYSILSRGDYLWTPRPMCEVYLSIFAFPWCLGRLVSGTLLPVLLPVHELTYPLGVVCRNKQRS